MANKPNRFAFRGKFSKNKMDDDNNNKYEKKTESVITKTEIFKSKYNPQIESTTTTTTTTSSHGGPTYFSRRRFQQKEIKEEEPKIENKTVNTEQGVKKRFRYMQGK